MIKEIRGYLYATMEVPAVKDNQGWYYEVFMMALIIANTIAMIIESVPSIYAKYQSFFVEFEYISIAIFTIEYILLLWVCTENKKYHDPIRGRIQYALTPMALINLVSILPFFLLFGNTEKLDLRALRMFRLLRFFRVLKLTKYSDSLRILGKALDRKKEQLIMTFLIVILLVVMASICIYYAEHEDNNNDPPFTDIPTTIIWGLAKLSPVTEVAGSPQTVPGKMIGATLGLLELAIFAIPAGIMANAFEKQADEIEEKRHKAQEKKLATCEAELKKMSGSVICPHCGKAYVDTDEN